MSSPKLEEEGVLREWAPMSKLLQQIPMRMRQGMFLEELKITCIDATSECIVLGTNCGTVFWYDRGSHYVQQLRPEKGASKISCVRVVSTVDFMVACGDNSGIVSIFKIPKALENGIGIGTNMTEKIERYTIDGLHKVIVTALEWSKNGQKLFSGDSEGVVVFTEMDFVMNISKAREVLNERYSIVQLCYNQREQSLLVATVMRCILWHGLNTNQNITQIGQRDRPSLLPLGGTIVSDESGEVFVYSCRGGLKLWKADFTGEVKYTILFKDALKKCNNPVKLLKPLETLENNKKLPEFGRIYYWRDGLFASFTKDSIIVFDPVQASVVATLLNVNEIVSACNTRTELFLVSGKRDLIRLGYTPDLYDSSIGGFGNMATGECVSGLPEVSIEPVYGSPLSTSSNRNSYLSASTANSELSTSEVIYGTDPSVLPPVVSLHDGVPELRVEPSRYQQFTTIGQQDFDDIIYSQKKLQKNKNRRKSAEIVEPKPKSSGVSFDGFSSYVNSLGKFLNGEFSSSVCDGELEPAVGSDLPQNILPDLRDLKSIVEDVARKEMLLEASLESLLDEKKDMAVSNENVPQIIEDLSSNNGKNSSKQHEIKSDDLSRDEIKDVVSAETENEIIQDESKQIKETEENRTAPSVLELQINNPNSDSICSETDCKLQIDKTEEESISNSGDKKVVELLTKSDENEMDNGNPVTCENVNKHIGESNSPSGDESSNVPVDPVNNVTCPLEISDSYIYGGWSSMNCPDYPAFLSTWKGGIILSSPKFKVYYTTENSWSLLDYKAQFVIVSNSGNLGVRIHCSIAQYSDDWMRNKNWKMLCRDAQHAAVSDDMIWFISRGELFHLSIKEKKIHPIPCNSLLSKVYVYKSVLFAVTTEGLVLTFKYSGWQPIKGIRDCKLLCVGPNQLIWYVDSQNGLYVADMLTEKELVFWQVSVTGNKDNEIINIGSYCDTIYVVSTNNIPVILFNKTYITGHTWIPSALKVECNQIAAGGVFEDKGCVWVVDTTKKLIALDSTLIILEEVDGPCNIICMASAPEALWLLADDGSIYLRQGISHSFSNHNPVGKTWRKLNMEQLQSQIELVQLSCGPDAVWGCDIRGKIVMVVGSPHQIAEEKFIPVWVCVDGKPIENNTFTKVYVGPETHMVWALDNAGNIYVREGIFPYHPVGTGWVHVPHIRASTLTISSEAVYALNRDGIYKRVGITQSNYIGDAWIYFPFISLNFITASFDGALWGICSRTKHLMKHKKKTILLSKDLTVENDFELL